MEGKRNSTKPGSVALQGGKTKDTLSFQA